jgi:hypothetical protein
VWQRSSQQEVLLWMPLGGAWQSAAEMCGTTSSALMAWALSSVPMQSSGPSLNEEKFWVKAHNPVGVDDGGVHGRRLPPWRHRRGPLLSLLMSMTWALRVKLQALVC